METICGFLLAKVPEEGYHLERVFYAFHFALALSFQRGRMPRDAA